MSARSVLAHVVLAGVGARIHAPGPDGEEREVTRERLADLLPAQAVFYANHSSHLDFVTLWAVLPPDLQRRVRPVAAADYWGAGLRRRVATGWFNAYLVDRGGGRDGRRTRRAGAGSRSGVVPEDGGQLQGMLDILARGDSLIIFPEGTRGSGERVAEFKAGLHVLAAAHPEVPVVPVSLLNLGRILPKGEGVPVPHLSTVRFHRPLAPPPPTSSGAGPGADVGAAPGAAPAADDAARRARRAARSRWLAEARDVLARDIEAQLGDAASAAHSAAAADRATATEARRQA